VSAKQGMTTFEYGLSASQSKITSLFITSYFCALILMGFVITSDQFQHWFVIPVMLCGILIGSDAVDWMRGRANLFDPAGLLGFLGFHFFFLAPLLHVMWDQWMLYITPPPDWRPWLGGMAILNCLGLLAYRSSRGPCYGRSPLLPRELVWRMAPTKFFPIVSLALVITGLLQLWIYQQYGGIQGYISTYMESRAAGFTDEGFKGMGILFTVSESFPILAMMAFVIYARQHKATKSWNVLLAVLLLYFILLMLFGGLRGSRSNTLYSLMWGVGMLHVFVRPVSKKILAIGLVFLIAFMYVYGFYKESGLQALTAFEGQAARAEMEQKTGRTFQGLLLGDLGRSDVQAFLLYRLWAAPTNYEYAWGRTYLGTAALLVPRAIWPERPVTKVKDGTEAMFGKGSHRPGMWEAANVYGLAGETMLNFGPLAVPLAFIVLGLGVKKVRRLSAALDEQDIRLLMIPFLLILAANVLVSDSDNLLWWTVKSGMVPFLVIAAGSSKSFIRSSHLSVSQ
jgi:hypothetical protein